MYTCIEAEFPESVTRKHSVIVGERNEDDVLFSAAHKFKDDDERIAKKMSIFFIRVRS